MSSFSAILSSLQNGKPPPAASQSSPARSNVAQPNGGSAVPSTKAVTVPVSKRKADDESAERASKVARLASSNTAKRPVLAGSKLPPSHKDKLTSADDAPSTPYRGTAQPSARDKPAISTAQLVGKPPGVVPVRAAPSSASNPSVKTKRGFASIMEKAKAAQEAAKTAGYDTIKHKPTERLSKKDRLRLAGGSQDQSGTVSTGKPDGKVPNSTGGAPVRGMMDIKHSKGEGKAPGIASRKHVELSYKGTMRPGASNAAIPKKKSKDLGQDRYGGYASWSDLDGAEDEDHDSYDSESDMEGGYDDMMNEEFESARVARKEDQAALEEEERLKREKLERKKKLMALNKDAAAKKKY